MANVKRKTGLPDDSERRFEILLEQIRSEGRVVAEGHSLLVKEMRETREMLEKRLEFLERATVEGFNKVWEAITQTNKRLDTTNGRLDDLVTRFDVHERAHAA